MANIVNIAVGVTATKILYELMKNTQSFSFDYNGNHITAEWKTALLNQVFQMNFTGNALSCQESAKIATAFSFAFLRKESPLLVELAGDEPLTVVSCVLSKPEFDLPIEYFQDVTTYNIVLENHSEYDNQFFIFMQPALYTGGPKVFANSLGCGHLSPYDPATPQQLQFQYGAQYRAAAQLQTSPPSVGVLYTTKIAQSLVSLSPSSENSTLLSIGQDGNPNLSAPRGDQDVPNGCFRITTPVYNPNTSDFNIGMGGVCNGVLTLANYITARPNFKTDIQPVMKFYINTGYYQAGKTINWQGVAATSAVCDATNGKLSFKVMYNPDGTWTVA